MSTSFNPYWLGKGAAVPVDIPTTAALVAEIQQLRQALSQRPPLTDEEIDAITRDRWGTKLLGAMMQMHREYARAIERAVRGE